MYANTFSIVVGSRKCDAHCPFCISRQTGYEDVADKVTRIHPDFKKACRLAQMAGTTNVLFTGKGEPLLYANEISEYLKSLGEYDFPFIAVQTNGLRIGRCLQDREAQRTDSKDADIGYHLEYWRTIGMDTIALSVVSVHDADNAKVYAKNYPPLEKTVAFLRNLGYTIRLSVMMMKGVVDSTEKLMEVVRWCREHDVGQLTVRPIRKPDTTSGEGNTTARFVEENGLDANDEKVINDYVVANASRPLLRLSHGAVIYDIEGQNLCLTDCLTIPDDVDHIRTLIWYGNGRLAYDWSHRGAVLLQGGPEGKPVQARIPK